MKHCKAESKFVGQCKTCGEYEDDACSLEFYPKPEGWGNFYDKLLFIGLSFVAVYSFYKSFN